MAANVVRAAGRSVLVFVTASVRSRVSCTDHVRSRRTLHFEDFEEFDSSRAAAGSLDAIIIDSRTEFHLTLGKEDTTVLSRVARQGFIHMQSCLQQILDSLQAAYRPLSQGHNS